MSTKHTKQANPVTRCGKNGYRTYSPIKEEMLHATNKPITVNPAVSRKNSGILSYQIMKFNKLKLVHFFKNTKLI
jgi:hypothetical protein